MIGLEGPTFLADGSTNASLGSDQARVAGTIMDRQIGGRHRAMSRRPKASVARKARCRYLGPQQYKGQDRSMPAGAVSRLAVGDAGHVRVFGR
jgi:hypothetical protein